MTTSIANVDIRLRVLAKPGQWRSKPPLWTGITGWPSGLRRWATCISTGGFMGVLDHRGCDRCLPVGGHSLITSRLGRGGSTDTFKLIV